MGKSKTLLVSSLVCGAVLAAGIVGVKADQVSNSQIAHSVTLNNGNDGAGVDNPATTPTDGNQPDNPAGNPSSSTSNDPRAHMDQNKPLTGPTASNGQPNTWNGDPNQPCTKPLQIGPNAYEVGVMDPAAFNAMSWVKYFLAQKDPNAKILKVGVTQTPYGYVKVFKIQTGSGQIVNFKLKIDTVGNAPHIVPLHPENPQANVSDSEVKATEQAYQNKKHPHVQADQMHPVAVLDVSVSGNFDCVEADNIIQTTANNRAIHVDMANVFPVDPQQNLHYFYVETPSGKEYLLAFRVQINNQIPKNQFSCQLESGQLPWPTQGITPAYNNPETTPGSNNPGDSDPYGNSGNDNPTDDPYGNPGNDNPSSSTSSNGGNANTPTSNPDYDNGWD